MSGSDTNAAARQAAPRVHQEASGLQLTYFFSHSSSSCSSSCIAPSARSTHHRFLHTSSRPPPLHHPLWRSSSPICTFLTSERIIVSHHRPPPPFFSPLLLLLLAVCCCPRSSWRARVRTCVRASRACLSLPVGGDYAQCHGKLGEKLNEAPIMCCLAAPHDPAAAAAAGKQADREGRNFSSSTDHRHIHVHKLSGLICLSH